MTPLQSYKLLLDWIYKSQEAMSSPEWVLAREKATPEEKKKEAKIKRKLQSVKLQLESAQLENILKKLMDNRQGIINSTSAMQQALTNLQAIKAVLKASAALVAVAVKIISRLAK